MSDAHQTELSPSWHELQSSVLQSTVMQLDATSLPVRGKEHGYGLQLGSLCAYVGDQENVVYLYASTARKKGQRVGELGPVRRWRTRRMRSTRAFYAPT